MPLALRCLLLVSLLLPTLAAPPLELLSRRGSPPATARAANGSSFAEGISGNGRYVLFVSDATDVMADDANGASLDVFRHDLLTGKIDRVSVFGTNGVQPGLNSYRPTISDDGLRVAFLTEGRDPGVSDFNQGPDFYVRHLPATPDAQPWTELVSVRADGQGTGDSGCTDAAISDDGRYVLFECDATNLVSGVDLNYGEDVFLRDLEAGTTIRISSTPDHLDAGDRYSFGAVMNRDASVVVFRSGSTNFVLEPATGNITDVHVWSRTDGTLRRLSLPGPETATNRYPIGTMNHVLSADGRYLTFRTGKTNELNGIWWYDLVAGTNAWVSSGLTVNSGFSDSGLSMTADGRTVAFQASTAGSSDKVWIWNADSGLHSLESLQGNELPLVAEPVTSEDPVLSADGTKLAFVTQAAVPGTDIGTGGSFHLVVRTLSTGKTYTPSTGPEDSESGMIYMDFDPAGGRILFDSEITLDPERDKNGVHDVFLAELDDGKVNLLSTASETATSVTPSGPSSLLGRFLSQDARFVVFSSFADDVVAGDTNRSRDIFRFDRQTGQTLQVNRRIGGQSPNAMSTPLQVSADGRFVLFFSYATNLVAGPGSRSGDVFLSDLDADTLVSVNLRDGSDQASTNGHATAAMISPDGKRVLFVSTSRDLVTQPVAQAGSNLYLRDMDTRRTVLLSRSQVGMDAAGKVLQAALQQDGQRAVFLAGNVPSLYLCDIATASLRLLTTNRTVSQFELSPDGRRMAYLMSSVGSRKLLHLRDLSNDQEKVFDTIYTAKEFQFSGDGDSLVFSSGDVVPEQLTLVADTNKLSDVFHYDFKTDRLRLISSGASGQSGDGYSGQPWISRDGRRVVFRSVASDLVAGDTNGSTDVFLWEAGVDHLVLLSGNPATGLSLDGFSSSPAISEDGRFVTFVSSAADAVAGDNNFAPDVFGMTLSPPGDTDTDGLEDSWELASFGNLDQTAGGDPDGDGQTNLDGYIAGTHPAQAGSVFRLMAQPSVEGGITVTWQSQVGVTYLVEISASPASSFTQSGAAIPGDGTTKSVQLALAGDASFLRVRAQR